MVRSLMPKLDSTTRRSRGTTTTCVIVALAAACLFLTLWSTEISYVSVVLPAMVSLNEAPQHRTLQQQQQPPLPPEVPGAAARKIQRNNVPPTWLWKPLKTICLTNGVESMNIVTSDPFPPNFDVSIYPKGFKHYQTVGRGEGRLATRGQQMRQIINSQVIPHLPGNKLELGPFLNPIIYGDSTIKYFDVLNLKGLQARAAAIGYPVVRKVKIDYVNPTGDLTSIPDKESFSLITSAHVVEHQLDLVRHLNAVSNLLLPGGYYVLIVPDKRYCFDHNIPVTTIADVLEDFHLDRYHAGSHKLKSVLEHRALTGHNDATRNWSGDHSPPLSGDVAHRLNAALAEYKAGKARNQYVDVHNYQFTPNDLAQIVDTLHAMELTPMRVHRVYETLRNTFEFVVVLKKCGLGASAKVDK